MLFSLDGEHARKISAAMVRWVLAPFVLRRASCSAPAHSFYSIIPYFLLSGAIVIRMTRGKAISVTASRSGGIVSPYSAGSSRLLNVSDEFTIAI